MREETMQPHGRVEKESRRRSSCKVTQQPKASWFSVLAMLSFPRNRLVQCSKVLETEENLKRAAGPSYTKHHTVLELQFNSCLKVEANRWSVQDGDQQCPEREGHYLACYINWLYSHLKWKLTSCDAQNQQVANDIVWAWQCKIGPLITPDW